MPSPLQAVMPFAPTPTREILQITATSEYVRKRKPETPGLAEPKQRLIGYVVQRTANPWGFLWHGRIIFATDDMQVFGLRKACLQYVAVFKKQDKEDEGNVINLPQSLTEAEAQLASLQVR
eukprot:scaffold679505_cov57-Prasinocladus_malaysianus.AAC.1